MTLPNLPGAIPASSGDDPFVTDDPFVADDFDGHTLEQLSDYLDSNRQPADPTIDYSPACQLALNSLVRLRAASALMLEQDASAEPALDDGWLQSIVSAISRDLHAGRDIPLSHPSPDAELSLTEGAAKALIRSAGDHVQGLLVGRCALLGEVATRGAEIIVYVDVTIRWGVPIFDAVHRLRSAVARALAIHTELRVVGIDVTVRDVYVGRDWQSVGTADDRAADNPMSGDSGMNVFGEGPTL